MYPGLVKTAREEGFEEISDWFETPAKAGKSKKKKATQGFKIFHGCRMCLKMKCKTRLERI